MEEINGVKIHCKYDALIDPKDLPNYSKNPNKHGQDQIERLSKVFKYTGVRHPIVFDKERNCIAAGHGRKLAAILIGMEKYPVVYQTFKDNDEFYAFVTADNALSDWSSLDLSEINSMIETLGPDFDIDFLGIRDFKIDMSDFDTGSLENPYTRKIEAPIYEITGECPPISELIDLTYYKDLLNKISESNLSEDKKEFLKFAACRHIRFNYKNIAEYYAHAEAEEQSLMENSALIIIDFNKAIELGFVNLTKEIMESFEENNV